MNSQIIVIIMFTASIANYYYFVNNALAQTGSTPGTAPGSTIIELSPLIQSIRMHVNETVVALQNKNIQGAITHLKLINNQLADLSMINARGIINGTKPPVH